MQKPSDIHARILLSKEHLRQFFMRSIHFLPLSLLYLLPSCGKKAAAGPPHFPPAAVTFVPAASEDIHITEELPGRIDALRVSEVRARVAGILLERCFQEGADVKAGQVLFKIDPAPLEAARDSAAAVLARSDASLSKARSDSKRSKQLVASQAISEQEAQNSETALQIGEADLLSAKAALKTAELNLGYATVTAPIDGRIGIAAVTEGALVGQGSATLLATIQQLDPIYFDFTRTSGDLAALKNAAGSASDVDEQNKVTLLLEDGSEYPLPGKILFSEAFVDETTGMVTLRAKFPNPKHDLLPGMFARVRVLKSVKDHAVTVPQRTVARGVGGVGTVMVIDDANKAQLRNIQTGEIVGDKWIVTSGLKAGEKVIVEGLLKARPGASVVPEPFVPAAKSATGSNNH
jgi:membrane fusion protein (multidrug efflux system)